MGARCMRPSAVTWRNDLRSREHSLPFPQKGGLCRTKSSVLFYSLSQSSVTLSTSPCRAIARSGSRLRVTNDPEMELLLAAFFSYKKIFFGFPHG
jgi:hypothetical protein